MCESSSFSIELRDEAGELVDPVAEGLEAPEITVDIVGPKGGVVASKTLKPSSTPGIVDVSYVPLNTGLYTAHVHINGQALPQSPFTILCSRQPTDATKCLATGSGLQDMVSYGEKPNSYAGNKKNSDNQSSSSGNKARFFIEARDSQGRAVKGGGDDVKVSIKGKKSSDGTSVVVNDVSVSDGGNGCYTVEYLPEEYGDYEIDVTINGAPMPQLTGRKVSVKRGNYNIQVSGTGFSESDASSNSYLTVGELADIRVRVEPETIAATNVAVQTPRSGSNSLNSGENVNELPEGLVVLKVVGEDGQELEVNVDESMLSAGGEVLGQYLPNKRGKFSVQVFVEGVKRFEKQLVCDRSQADPSKTVCYGPGVDGPVAVNAPTRFTVETRDRFGNPIGASIGSQCKVVIEELMHEATPASGDNKPVYTTIEAKVEDNQDGTFSVSYQPKNKGRHAIQVLIDGVPIGAGGAEAGDDNKIIVEAVPASYNVKFNTAHAEATAYQLNSFVISLEDTLGVPFGSGGNNNDNNKLPAVVIRAPDGGNTTSYAHVEVAKDEQTGKEIPGSFTVSYTPQSVGNHIIDVQVDGKSVGNPKIVKAVAKADASKTVIRNIAEVQAGASREFQLELHDASGQRLARGGDTVVVTITGENNNLVKSSLRDNNDGSYQVEFPDLPPGRYVIEASVNGENVPDTPISFVVSNLPYDFDVRGVGVIGGRVAPSVEFVIEITKREENVAAVGRPVGGRVRVKAQKANFQVSIVAPGGEVLVPKVNEMKDDSVWVSYPALHDGSYQVKVLFDKIVIPTFPRSVHFTGKKASAGYDDSLFSFLLSFFYSFLSITHTSCPTPVALLLETWDNLPMFSSKETTK